MLPRYSLDPCPARWSLCGRRVQPRPVGWSMYGGKGYGSKGSSKGSGGKSKGGSKGNAKGSTRSKGSDGGGGEKSEILVIGAGCTGALVAALLPLEAQRRGVAKPRVSVWEWGRGPAGRMTSFWTERDGARVVADVGAQVISLQDPTRLPAWMQDEVMVAENLSDTTERRKDWYHFYASGGLPSLQRASLTQADVMELHFNRRVMNLSYEGRWWASYSKRGTPRSAQWQDFELLIFAGTAQDALNLPGLRECLAPQQLQAMRGVRYDHRLALALIFKANLAKRLEELCQGRAELVVEESPIHLIARQDVKGRSHHDAVALVLHSTPAFAASNLQLAKQQNRPPKEPGKAALLASLAELLKMKVPELEKELLESKVVHWRQCQVQNPAQDLGSSAMLVDPMLILAGDYLAQEGAGSFQGCLDSAEAAATMACDLLYGPASEKPAVRRWGKQPAAKEEADGAAVSGKRWRAKG